MNISFNFPHMSAGITRLKNHSSELQKVHYIICYLLFILFAMVNGRVYFTAKIEEYQCFMSGSPIRIPVCHPPIVTTLTYQIHPVSS